MAAEAAMAAEVAAEAANEDEKSMRKSGLVSLTSVPGRFEAVVDGEWATLAVGAVAERR